jgi:hypothetical protein
MGTNLFDLLNDHKVDQIGYLYTDVENQAEKMEKAFGMPKFSFIPNATSKVTYRGNLYEMEAKIGFSRIMNTQIELIQWISGECYHKEHLEKFGEGFYHISTFVNELNPYFNLFETLKIDVLQERWVGKQHAVYFDTKDIIGVVLELQATERRRSIP